ncbi:MAG: ribose 5-phosphate isomerase B [Acidobacteria bacterium]|nr:ribose 5-phosphate isomerase B [Acidobacteriota bacterium]
MKLAFGSDHAGYELKTTLAEHARSLGHDVVDLGTTNTDRVDYPDFGAAVGRAVADGSVALGVCVCGSGIGIAMAAGKIDGIRAATVHDATSAHLAREHNDANVICIGERLVGPAVAIDALEAFLAASFEGGRHSGRVEKINALER